MKAMLRLVLLGIILYLGAVAWLYFNQRNILFHPDHSRVSKSGFFIQADNSEKVWITTLNPDKPHALLYFPGNTESGWEEPQRLAGNLPDHTIYFVHYRGFGQSEGQPSQSALYSDALKIFDTIKSKHKKIDLEGRSLGSAMATYTAAKREADKLVLVTPFDGIARLAKQRYPWMPINLLLKDPFPSFKYAPMVSEPTLVFLSEKDSTTPYESSKALIEKFTAKPETIMLRGVNHSDSIRHQLYFKNLKEFLED